ncbi:transporter substrate-binding protein [Bradyrhizobium diazoefficiens]|nr:ABC transporter substrate-binding protein [Bradyrhizobium diazoefficiens]QQN66713.1 transporter substrate-binding protein [Bradyrhizobium diazoefficiens]
MTISRRAMLQVMGGTLAVPYVARSAFAADPIKVAGIFDVSGGLDIYGQPMVACLDLAIDELNAAGGLLGRPLQLVKYDPQSDIQLYTQYATAAATKEKVAVVFGGITSASREAIRPILHRYQTPYFYPALYEGGVCDRNAFMTGSTPAQTIEKLIPFVTKKWGKKIYIIAADYNYGQISAKWVRKYARDNGAEVVGEEFFPLDVTEFGTTISKIQAAKPDLVYSLLVGGNHMSFFRQWAAAGMSGKIPMASTDFGVGNEHIVLTPKESNGVIAAYAYFQELDNLENKAFLSRLRAKFGDKTPYVNELAAETWYAVAHWARSVKAAGKLDRDVVLAALEGSTIDGPGGKSTIDPSTHHCKMDVHIGEVKNHAFVVLESYAQQAPSDTAAVCDLKKNPNDNQQYVISVGN